MVNIYIYIIYIYLNYKTYGETICYIHGRNGFLFKAMMYIAL